MGARKSEIVEVEVEVVTLSSSARCKRRNVFLQVCRLSLRSLRADALRLHPILLATALRKTYLYHRFRGTDNPVSTEEFHAKTKKVTHLALAPFKTVTFNTLESSRYMARAQQLLRWATV